jgi:hypothetical protein
MSDPEETPDVYGGFPAERRADGLAALGERRNAPTGQVLVAEGSRHALLVRGMAAVVGEDPARRMSVWSACTAKGFPATNLLRGEGVPYTITMAEPGRCWSSPLGGCGSW